MAVPCVSPPGARMVRELFSLARSKKTCIIFFDEVDAIGGARYASTSPHYPSALRLPPSPHRGSLPYPIITSLPSPQDFWGRQQLGHRGAAHHVADRHGAGRVRCPGKHQGSVSHGYMLVYVWDECMYVCIGIPSTSVSPLLCEQVLMATNRPDTLDPALLRPGTAGRLGSGRLKRCHVMVAAADCGR